MEASCQWEVVIDNLETKILSVLGDPKKKEKLLKLSTVGKYCAKTDCTACAGNVACQKMLEGVNEYQASSTDMAYKKLRDVFKLSVATNYQAGTLIEQSRQ